MDQHDQSLNAYIGDKPFKPKNMTTPSLSHFIFNTHHEAEEATKLLDQAGFDIKKISIVGKGYHSEEHPIGFYTTGDKIKLWGSTGALWGSLWGMLFLPAVFFVPGFGLLAMAGPFVGVLISAIEGALVGGGLSALGAALSQVGVPDNLIMKYELAIKADQFVMLIHGDAADHVRVCDIFKAKHIQSSESTSDLF